MELGIHQQPPSFRMSKSLLNTSSPPIPIAMEWAKGYQPTEGEPLINVSQGVPRSGPHQSLRDALSQQAMSDEAYRYGDIMGEAILRDRLAEEMRLVYGAETNVISEDIALTAGCNLAFYASIMAIASTGDEIILPCPWYFNHQMTLQMNGINAVPLPTPPSTAFIPSVLEAEKLITTRTRAIVLVTPNNPTGAIYPPAQISSFVELAHKHQIALILDETYRDFVLDDEGNPKAPHSVFMTKDWRQTVIHLFSFSKSYSIPGMRLGAIVASPVVLEQVRKVLDCIQICPPKAIQLALCAPASASPPGTSENSVIASLRPTLLTTARNLQQRQRIFRKALIDSPYRVEGGNGYYAFVQIPSTMIAQLVSDPGRTPSADTGVVFCREFARKHGVVCLPASFFAIQTLSKEFIIELDQWVRVSVANMDDDAIRDVAKRLLEFYTDS
ncbi:PLP-dependent transferase [Clavulina sp. PMI_390]|nr:PLP-dependent transferase [Clavulina sp. PMI_390]